jgi:hypothetical protein
LMGECGPRVGSGKIVAVGRSIASTVKATDPGAGLQTLDEPVSTTIVRCCHCCCRLFACGGPGPLVTAPSSCKQLGLHCGPASVPRHHVAGVVTLRESPRLPLAALPLLAAARPAAGCHQTEVCTSIKKQ